MQVLHRVNQACECLSEINSLVISDVIIENGNYLLQEYFYPLRHPTGDHPPQWGGIRRVAPSYRGRAVSSRRSRLV